MWQHDRQRDHGPVDGSVEVPHLRLGSDCIHAKGARWIVRAADASDRRVKRLAMTGEARNTLSEAQDVGRAVADEALAGLSAAERRTLIKLLEKVRHNLMAAIDADAKE